MVADPKTCEPEEIETVVNPSQSSEDDGPQLTREERIKEIETLMKEGNRAFLFKDYVEATENFSRATEHAAAVYGDLAAESFEPFYQYGRALVELAFYELDNAETQLEGLNTYLAKKTAERKQKIAGVEKITEEKEEGKSFLVDLNYHEPAEAADEKAVHETAPKVEKPVEDGTTQNDTVDEKVVCETAPEVEKPIEDEPAQNDNVAQPEEGNETFITEAADDDEGEEEPEQTTTELAYEILEVARIIAERQEEVDDWALRRADVHYLLGQLAVIEEKFKEAVEDLSAALEIRKKFYPEHDRRIASYFFEIAEALKNDNQFLASVDFYTKAEDSMKIWFGINEKTVENLTGEELDRAKKDMEDMKASLADIATLIEDAKGSAKAMELKKAEMAKEENVENICEPIKEDEPITEITVIRKKRPASDNSPIKDDVKKIKADDGVENSQPDDATAVL